MSPRSGRQSTLRMGSVLTALVLAILLGGPVAAQAQEPRLVGRLPDAARAQVDDILSAATAEGLPVEPLVDRALEGAAKGAPPDRVVVAVTRLRDELRLARDAFGTDASAAELSAGAAALRAGAQHEDLAQLRELRPGQPMTVAAGVLADLASAGVPADTAIAAVLALAAYAQDADYIAFRRNVERDIALGASPAAALGVRLRTASEALAPGDGLQTGGSSGPRRKRKP